MWVTMETHWSFNLKLWLQFLPKTWCLKNWLWLLHLVPSIKMTCSCSLHMSKKPRMNQTRMPPSLLMHVLSSARHATRWDVWKQVSFVSFWWSVRFFTVLHMCTSTTQLWPILRNNLVQCSKFPSVSRNSTEKISLRLKKGPTEVFVDEQCSEDAHPLILVRPRLITQSTKVAHIWNCENFAFLLLLVLCVFAAPSSCLRLFYTVTWSRFLQPALWRSGLWLRLILDFSTLDCGCSYMGFKFSEMCPSSSVCV